MSTEDRTQSDLARELQSARARIAELENHEEQLRDRVRKLEGLCTALKAVSGVLDMGDFRDNLEVHLRGVVPFDRIGIALVRDDRHFEHLETREIMSIQSPEGERPSATDWVVKNHKPLIRREILSDDRYWASKSLRRSGARSDIILPLISRNQVVAMLSFASKETGIYAESNLGILQPVADHMAVLLDNARLYRDLDKAYRELELIYNRVSDFIFLMRVEPGHVYRCISANQACIESLGLSEEDVLGKRIEEFLPGPVLAVEKAKFTEAVEAGAPVQYELSSDLPGGPVTFENTVVPILDRAGNCTRLLGVARNVSERKRTEQEIIRLERLHALEEMARGVSHNFNNILVGVLGYAQLIEMHSKDHQTVDNAKEIVESALRAKELVQRLNLAVGKKAYSPPDLLDNLDAIVQDAIEAIRPSWKDEAEAHGLGFEVVSTPGNVPPVGATSEGLQRILVHLISNAVDAMPGGAGSRSLRLGLERKLS